MQVENVHFKKNIAGASVRCEVDRRKEYSRFERLTADISARFVNIASDQIDPEIERALELLLEFFQVDRCVLLGLSPDLKRVHVTHAAYSEDIWRVSGDIDLAELFPWLYERMVLQRQPVCLDRLDDLPEWAEQDKLSCTAISVKSFLDIPIIFDGEVSSLIVLNATRTECAWPKEYVPRLRLMGEILINALERRKIDRAFRESEEKLRDSYNEISRLKERLEEENSYLRRAARSTGQAKSIIGQSDAIRYVQYRIGQVSSMDTTVLILGETGTGKGLVAQAVHEASRRKDRPLIHVNCAVLPANLIESELFGRDKGAFTGAQSSQIGRFQLADNGTIVLDEIAELPVELQAKLLRVLEQGEFERLGNPRTIKVDVRIIASTNRNLEEEVRTGRFREDLFYRLNVFPVTVPPLRERSEDIPLLVTALIERLNKEMGRRITTVPSDVMLSLQNYRWPGNVRELENIIERAVIMSRGTELQLAEPFGAIAPPVTGVREATPICLESMERSHILKTVEALKWKIGGPSGAAHALGLKPSTLRSRMQKLSILRPHKS
jgi:formate hydrogenlyase transcriptional activator